MLHSNSILADLARAEGMFSSSPPPVATTQARAHAPVAAPRARPQAPAGDPVAAAVAKAVAELRASATGSPMPRLPQTPPERGPAPPDGPRDYTETEVAPDSPEEKEAARAFGSVAGFRAYQRARAEGRAKIITARVGSLATMTRGLPPVSAGPDAWSAAFDADPALQREFASKGDFMAFMRAAARAA